MIYLIYYYLISFCLLGYGFLLSRILNLKFINFGFLGLFGISFLISISYLTTLFFVHDYFFNLVILISGIFLFTLFYKKKFYKYLLQHLIIFTVLIIFILVAKNHDDFSYYHYPYSYFLTQFEHPIGFGHLNNGFRNPSSIFFLNSLFYYPKIEFYLLNISQVFFLGFSNIILINLIFNKKIFKKLKFINFLSLLVLSFINIFFYRLAEHGTDRSGMILILIIIILIFLILNNNNKLRFINELNLFYIILILLTILISLKPFYLIYSPLILCIFTIKFFRINFYKIIYSKIIFYSYIFVFFIFFFNFINSGCLVYPAAFTCFDNLQWSFSKQMVGEVNEWYELWAKAGASPNYIVENRSEYISNFNWLNNWINNYFFNKVSDFLLGLTLFILIFGKVFLRLDKKIYLTKQIKYKIVYIFLLICLIEWFFKHPALRYGGYQLFALICFIPLALLFNSQKMLYKNFYKKSFIMVIIIFIIFFSRNLNRIIEENEKYDFNPFLSTKYIFDEKFYNRYIYHVEERQNEFKKINLFGKNFIITMSK